MLGQCHAEHDADPLAIHCLERAVAEDPYHLDALLNLGVRTSLFTLESSSRGFNFALLFVRELPKKRIN